MCVYVYVCVCVCVRARARARARARVCVCVCVCAGAGAGACALTHALLLQHCDGAVLPCQKRRSLGMLEIGGERGLHGLLAPRLFLWLSH